MLCDCDQLTVGVDVLSRSDVVLSCCIAVALRCSVVYIACDIPFFRCLLQCFLSSSSLSAVVIVAATAASVGIVTLNDVKLIN